jgi:hypothetical protein
MTTGFQALEYLEYCQPFFFCLFFLPETSYRRPYIYGGVTAAEADKEATEMIGHQHKTPGDDLAVGTYDPVLGDD